MATEVTSKDKSMYTMALHKAGVDHFSIWLGQSLDITLVCCFDPQKRLSIVAFNADGSMLYSPYLSDDAQNFIRGLPTQDVRTPLSQLTHLLDSLGIAYTQETNADKEPKIIITGIHAVFNEQENLIQWSYQG